MRFNLTEFRFITGDKRKAKILQRPSKCSTPNTISSDGITIAVTAVIVIADKNVITPRLRLLFESEQHIPLTNINDIPIHCWNI